MLIHRHRPAECRVAYAAWRAYDSPLRGKTAQSTCRRHVSGDSGADLGVPDVHELWCTVRAEDAASALAQLPPFVAERTEAREVTELKIA
jgi:hypothetical protein